MSIEADKSEEAALKTEAAELASAPAISCDTTVTPVKLSLVFIAVVALIAILSDLKSGGIDAAAWALIGAASGAGGVVIGVLFNPIENIVNGRPVVSNCRCLDNWREKLYLCYLSVVFNAAVGLIISSGAVFFLVISNYNGAASAGVVAIGEPMRKVLAYFFVAVLFRAMYKTYRAGGWNKSVEVWNNNAKWDDVFALV